MRGNRNVGGCPSGGGGGETKSPKERYDLFFLQHFYRAELPLLSSLGVDLTLSPELLCQRKCMQNKTATHSDLSKM
jgi:hypothetical protein